MLPQSDPEAGLRSSSTPAGTRTGNLRDVLLACAVVLTTSLLAFVRLPATVRDTLWAEDGTLFLSEALTTNPGLLEPYAGYLHFAPRLIARAVARFAYVRDFAKVLNLLACGCAGLISGAVFLSSRDVVQRLAPRLALSALTVILPLAGVEVLSTLANLHSLFLWGTFWVLFFRPSSYAQSIPLALFLLVAALTEIQTVFLMPLAVVLLWTNRSRHQLLAFLAFSVGVASEIRTTLIYPRASMGSHPPTASHFLQLLGLQVGMPLWTTNSDAIRDWLTQYGWGLALLAGMPVLLGLIGAVALGKNRTRAAAVCAAGFALSLFTLSHTLNFDPATLDPQYSVLESARVLIRYAVVPQMLLASVLVLAVDAALQRSNKICIGMYSILSLALVGSAVLNLTSDSNRRNPDTQWTRQLRGALAICQTHPMPARASFRISPGNWQAEVPCRRILRDERKYQERRR